jgi:hypothetical protein
MTPSSNMIFPVMVVIETSTPVQVVIVFHVLIIKAA